LHAGQLYCPARIMDKLYKHQEDLLKISPNKCGIFWEPGSGKSLMSIKLIDSKNIEKCLVVTPKSIRLQFEEEIKKFSTSKTNYKVITKEELRRDWKKYTKYDGCIIDECHAHTGYTNKKKQSQLYKSTIGFIKQNRLKCLYLMTGTPYRSSPMGIFALSEFLEIGWDYKTFKNWFFIDVNMGMRWPIPVVKKGMEKDIATLVKKLGYTAKLQDLFDVPTQTFQLERFSLTPDQKKAIKKLEDVSPIARFTKTHCIENGIKNSDGYSTNEYYKCEKTNRILDLCDEHKKISIVARYNLQLRLYKELLEKNGKKVFLINGDLEDKYSTVNEINELEECVVLIQSDTCAGYNLWSVPVMVFASYSWSLVSYLQIIGRILRSNHLKKNLYISLIQDNKSIDYAVYDNVVNKKKDFVIEIFKKRE